jgi:hypothetical protein
MPYNFTQGGRLESYPSGCPSDPGFGSLDADSFEGDDGNESPPAH